MQEQNKAAKRKISFFATMRTVFWSFFGVGKGKKSVSDVENLNPVHVVIAGILGALILITVLIVIVKIVLSKVVI
ncbi:DUF2970 domain-containing protein [Actimicrobium sp. CCC2.4]|uniref:DUF2970 domain-containing protein n=1 Tax=Actimicrobium sp. CCC2.4 TaxID=3048606 RepID=UPI002AC8B3C2|nr:DUF2970 domain-containing protein [Actimicrobium sp. CCC2.4]MEB0134261.1 DUF2970 domain-containing protein [Actimicrobium sp. CCC2.4]WPX34082.1 DUF2970 domain-containing protein [Actimicrobium sp. CCC2.4]